MPQDRCFKDFRGFKEGTGKKEYHQTLQEVFLNVGTPAKLFFVRRVCPQKDYKHDLT